MTGLILFFCISSSFANTTNNLYDANGYLVSSCNEEGCSYQVYKGLSQVGTIAKGSYLHYLAGPQGKLASVKKSQSSKTTWLNNDFHGTVVTTVSEGQAKAMNYDAFGNLLYTSDALAKVNSRVRSHKFSLDKDIVTESVSILDTSSNEDLQIYTDKHLVNEEASFYNFNARFYDPFIGRFSTTDPIEHTNWYTFTNNNPLSFVDPTGMGPEEDKALLQQTLAEVDNTFDPLLDALWKEKTELENQSLKIMSDPNATDEMLEQGGELNDRAADLRKDHELLSRDKNDVVNRIKTRATNQVAWAAERRAAGTGKKYIESLLRVGVENPERAIQMLSKFKHPTLLGIVIVGGVTYFYPDSAASETMQTVGDAIPPITPIDFVFEKGHVFKIYDVNPKFEYFSYGFIPIFSLELTERF